MLNIHTQHKFKYAHQQILFFKRLFNVKLIYSIQVLGPWLWGIRPFFFLSGGAEEGAQWGKCPTTYTGRSKRGRCTYFFELHRSGHTDFFLPCNYIGAGHTDLFCLATCGTHFFVFLPIIKPIKQQCTKMHPFVFYSDVKKRINAQQKIRKRAITKI
jgi:hypothetical protein